MSRVKIPTVSKSIPSVRQTSYGEDSIVYFMINANEVPLLNPFGTFLRFDVELGRQANLASGTINCNCHPSIDWAAGAYSCIRRLDVLTQNGVLLESIQDFGGLMSIKKHFERTRSLKGLWALEEGLCDPTQEQQKIPGQNTFSREIPGLPLVPWNQPTIAPTTPGPWVGVAAGAGVQPTGPGCYNPVKVSVTLPLTLSGVLGGSKVFPVAACGQGLEIRVYLSSFAESLRNFASYGYSRGSTDATVVLSQPPPGLIGSQNLPPVAPFPLPSAPAVPGAGNSYCFGNTVGFGAGAQPATFTMAAGLATALLGPECLMLTNPNQVPACIGGHLCYTDTAGANQITAGVIQSVTLTGGVGGTLVFNMSVPAGALVTATAAFANGANIGRFWFSNQALTSGSWVIDNTHLICGVVEPDPAYLSAMMSKMGSEGGLDVSIHSWNLYRNTVLSTERTAQLLIPTVEHRAESIISCPRNITPPTISKSEFMSECDHLSSYQWLLGSRLVPNRRVATDRFSRAFGVTDIPQHPTGWNAIAQAEMGKALGRCAIDLNNLTNGGDMFVVGRKLSEELHSYDAKAKDTRLNLYYIGTTAPNKNKQFQTQVYHIREINCSPTGVSVNF